MRATRAAIGLIVLATIPFLQKTGVANAQTVPQPTLIREPSGTAHRIPLLAAVLGILPGLGHVYAGEPGRGLIVAGVWLGSGMVAFSSSNKVVAGAGGVVLIGASVYGIADAALAAERFNRRHAKTATRPASVPTARAQ